MLYRVQNISVFVEACKFQDLNAQISLATRGLMAFKIQHFKS